MSHNLRQRKSVPLSRHAFDLKALHKTQQAVNALLNAEIIMGKTAQAHIADGGVKYEVPKQVDVEQYYPFKIYKPDISLLGNTGVIFDAEGVPNTIAINAFAPTNLPTTVNPKTDGWRIWAIREGMVSQRGYDFAQTDYQLFTPGGQAQVNLSDFSTSFEITTGCDTVGIGFQQGLPYDFDPSQSSSAAPVTIVPICGVRKRG